MTFHRHPPRRQHPGPITMIEPKPWYRCVNWGFAELLATMGGVACAMVYAIWSAL